MTIHDGLCTLCRERPNQRGERMRGKYQNSWCIECHRAVVRTAQRLKAEGVERASGRAAVLVATGRGHPATIRHRKRRADANKECCRCGVIFTPPPTRGVGVRCYCPECLCVGNAEARARRAARRPDGTIHTGVYDAYMARFHARLATRHAPPAARPKLAAHARALHYDYLAARVWGAIDA